MGGMYLGLAYRTGEDENGGRGGGGSGYDTELITILDSQLRAEFFSGLNKIADSNRCVTPFCFKAF